MNKQEIIDSFKEYAEKAHSITRDEFVKFCNISRHEIDKLFGNFTGLKNEVKIPRLEDNQNMIQIKANSLEEVLEKCNIDLKVWDVDYFNTKELSSGEFSWTVYFKRKKCIEGEINFEVIKQDLIKYSPIAPKIDYKHKDNDLFLEISMVDAHHGKLGSKDSDGGNYDIKISRKTFADTVTDLVSKAKCYGNFEKVLLWTGGDFLTCDNDENTTTKGTPQSVDSRFAKVFREGKEILIDSINYLKQFAPVELLPTSGNHDSNSMYHLGEVIDAYYHNDENVTVYNDPFPRYYYRFYNNAILFLHGHNVNWKKLSPVFAYECKFWSACENREIHSAHRHSEQVITEPGVITRIIPSITGPDGFHTSHAYVGSKRQAQAFIWHKNDGLQNIIYSKQLKS